MRFKSTLNTLATFMDTFSIYIKLKRSHEQWTKTVRFALFLLAPKFMERCIFFPNVFKVAHLSQIKLGWHVKTFTHIPFLWSVHHEIRAQRSHSILFLFIAVLFAITEQADWMSIVWRTFSLISTLAFFSLFIFTRKAIEHDDIPIPGQVIATA